MQQLIHNWPLVVLAQLLGVLVAWSVDGIGWELRRDANKVYAVNLVGSFAAGCFAIAFALPDVSLLFLIETWIPSLLWLFWLTFVQAKQLKTSLRDTFPGVLARFLCFLGTSIGSLLIAVPIYAGCNVVLPARVSLSFGLFAWIWIGSGALVYAVLSLFRPTIRVTWQTWRQNFGKI